jgi:hypothetical protein
MLICPNCRWGLSGDEDGCPRCGLELRTPPPADRPVRSVPEPWRGNVPEEAPLPQTGAGGFSLSGWRLWGLVALVVVALGSS